MAKSIEFDGYNKHMVNPMAEPEVDRIHGKGDMFGFSNGIITYTRWQLTPEEITQIAKTGEVWIAERTGNKIMRQHWVGSFHSIRQQCLDYGRFWKRTQPPRLQIEDKRENA
jgi:hypothetical protein